MIAPHKLADAAATDPTAAEGLHILLRMGELAARAAELAIEQHKVQAEFASLGDRLARLGYGVAVAPGEKQ